MLPFSNFPSVAVCLQMASTCRLSRPSRLPCSFPLPCTCAEHSLRGKAQPRTPPPGHWQFLNFGCFRIQEEDLHDRADDLGLHFDLTTPTVAEFKSQHKCKQLADQLLSTRSFVYTCGHRCQGADLYYTRHIGKSDDEQWRLSNYKNTLSNKEKHMFLWDQLKF